MKEIDEIELLAAITAGDLEYIKSQIDSSNVNSRAKDGGPFFQKALLSGKINVINWFIENNIDTVALRWSNQELIEYILFNCWRLPHEIKTQLVKRLNLKFENNVFELAYNGNKVELSRYSTNQLLIESQSGATVIHFSAAGGNGDLVEHLIVQKKVPADSKMNEGEGTALHIAAYNGQLSVVKCLIDGKHIAPDVTIKSGENALHIAATGGHLSVVKWLIEGKYIAPEAKNLGGATALHIAAFWGHLSVVKWLIEGKHIAPEAKDERGLTAWIHAAFLGHKSVMRWLIEGKYITPEATNPSGITALHIAALGGHLSMVQWLIEGKHIAADLKVKDGTTALDFAKINHSLPVVKSIHLYQQCDTKKMGTNNTCQDAQEELFEFIVRDPESSHATLLKRQLIRSLLEVNVSLSKALAQKKPVLLRWLRALSPSDIQSIMAMEEASGEGGHWIIDALCDDASSIFHNRCVDQVRSKDLQFQQYRKAIKEINFSYLPDGYDTVVKKIPLVWHQQPINTDGWSLLHYAAWFGDDAFLKTIFDKKVKRQKAANGWTPLHAAAASPYAQSDTGFDVVKLLLDDGLLIKTRGGRTVFHLMAANGRAGWIKNMLERLPATLSLPLKDANDKTAGDYAAQFTYDALANDLYRHELRIAAETGDNERITFLVEKQVIANPHEVNDKDGNNLLMISVMHHSHAMFDGLMQHKHFVHHQNRKGDNVLHLAAKAHNLHAFQSALSAKGLLTQKNQLNDTPLIVSIRTRADRIIEWLFTHQHKHVFGQKDRSGNTLLHLFAEYGLNDPRYVEVLKKKGCFTNDVENEDGQLPIDVAVVQNNQGLLNELISSHHTEVSVLINAVKQGLLARANTQIIQHLLSKAIKIFKIEKVSEEFLYGDNVLCQLVEKDSNAHQIHYLLANHKDLIRPLIREDRTCGYNVAALAVRKGRGELVRLLHKYSISFDRKDRTGRTPIYYAIENQDADMVDLLSYLGVNLTASRKIQIKIKSRMRGKVCSPETYVNDLKHAWAGNEARNPYDAIENIIKVRKTNRNAPVHLQTTQKRPENIVFQGGGQKGIAYVGAIQALEEKGYLAAVKRTAGASAGAITACLVAMGYGSDELTSKIMALDFPRLIIPENTTTKKTSGLLSNTLVFLKDNLIPEKVQSFLPEIKKLLELLQKNYQMTGVTDGEGIRTFIETQVAKKTGIDHCTFGELKALIERGLSFKHLHVVVTSTQEGIKMFSSEDPASKDVVIADAVTASGALPGVVEPQTIRIKTFAYGKAFFSPLYGRYLDGGILLNFPLDIFDGAEFHSGCEGASDKKVTCANLLSWGFRPVVITHDQRVSEAKDSIDNIGQMIRAIAGVYWNATNHYLEWKVPMIQERTVDIPVALGTIEFNASDDQKREAIKSGYEATMVRIKKKRIESRPDGFEKEEKMHEHRTRDILSLQPDNVDTRADSEKSLSSGSNLLRPSITHMPLAIIGIIQRIYFRYSPSPLLAELPKVITDSPCTGIETYHRKEPAERYRGEWLNRVESDPQTGESIHTYQLSTSKGPVGEAKFYKYRVLCRSEDGTRHNILALSGLFSEMQDELEENIDRIPDICEALPPTVKERLTMVSIKASQHGAVRGMSTVAGYAVKRHGYSAQVAVLTQKVFYCGAMVGQRFITHYTELTGLPETTKVFTAGCRAVMDTGQLVVVNQVLAKAGELASWAGEELERSGWKWSGNVLKTFGTWFGGYGVFAYDAVSRGVGQAATSIVSGVVTQRAVEGVGKVLVDGSARFFNQSSAKHVSTQGRNAMMKPK